MDIASGIYCIRNTVSDRRYVGSAVNITQRWRSHRSLLRMGRHHSRVLLRSWNKHGEEAFVFEVLEYVEDKTLLVAREQHWIDALNSACPVTGFNAAPKAGSALGFKHTDETRALMSRVRKGRRKSEVGRQNIRNALIIRNKSPEMRARVRASKLALYANFPERKEALLQQTARMWQKRRETGTMRGMYHTTPETRKKQSLAKKGRMTEAHKQAIVASNKRRALAARVGKDPVENQLFQEYDPIK